MSAPEWIVRPARASDRAALSAFSCARPGVPWEGEVEEFIQRPLWQWARDPHAKSNDPRLLLLLERATGKLVGVAAHERITLLGPDKEEFAATKLEVLAISHEENERSLEVCRRHGFIEELSRVSPSYRRLLTAHKGP